MEMGELEKAISRGGDAMMTVTGSLVACLISISQWPSFVNCILIQTTNLRALVV